MNSQETQTIEQLRERFQHLHTEKVRAEQDHKNAQETLETLKAQAHEQFGTDDIDQLKAMLQKIDAENLQKRQEYQAELEKIEGSLEAVESDMEDKDEKGEA